MTRLSTIPLADLRAALGGDDPCPPLERLAAAANGELGATETATVERHAAACATCAAELALARSFDSGESGLTAAERDEVDWVASRLESSPRRRGNGRLLTFGRSAPTPARRWQLWGALAASVAAVAIGSALLVPPAVPPLSQPEGSDVERGAELRLETELGSVAAPPDRLAWRPVAGATSYRVRLETVDGSVLVERDLPGTSFELDGAELARLETLVRYRVSIEAFDAAGAAVARSEPAELFVDPALR